MSVEQMIDCHGLPPKMSKDVNEFSAGVWDLVHETLNKNVNAGLVVAALELVKFQLVHLTCHDEDG